MQAQTGMPLGTITGPAARPPALEARATPPSMPHRPPSPPARRRGSRAAPPMATADEALVAFKRELAEIAVAKCAIANEEDACAAAQRAVEIPPLLRPLISEYRGIDRARERLAETAPGPHGWTNDEIANMQWALEAYAAAVARVRTAYPTPAQWAARAATLDRREGTILRAALKAPSRSARGLFAKAEIVAWLLNADADELDCVRAGSADSGPKAAMGVLLMAALLEEMRAAAGTSAAGDGPSIDLQVREGLEGLKTAS